MHNANVWLVAAPRIGFMQTVYSVVESSRAVVVLLESDGVNPQPVLVSYTTTAGSAASECCHFGFCR